MYKCRAERASSPAPQRESVERSTAARGDFECLVALALWRGSSLQPAEPVVETRAQLHIVGLWMKCGEGRRAGDVYVISAYAPVHDDKTGSDI